MTKCSFTILTTIKAGEIAAVESLLNAIGANLDDNPHIRFRNYHELHYASFSVLNDELRDPYLLFTGYVDGHAHIFLQNLLNTAGEGVHMIYRHCMDFPSDDGLTSGKTLAYLKAHDQGTKASFVAWPDRTVAEINRDQQLRDRIEALIDDQWWVLRGQPPRVIREDIRDRIAADCDLRSSRSSPTHPLRDKYEKNVAVLLGAGTTLTLGGLLKAALAGSTRRRRVASRVILMLGSCLPVCLAVLLRRKERLDVLEARQRGPWDTAFARWVETDLDEIVRNEDVTVQNNMVSVTNIKEGRFRYCSLRLVLFVLNLGANVPANKYSLAGIASTHFGRWIITPDRTRLIFVSNFDGSWESYVTGFVDLASVGINAVWSNTDNAVGFPPTRHLLFDGAYDEPQFKAFARSSMVPTNAWYSAYPDLTVGNIQNNAAIRKGLSSALDESETEAWLRRL